MVVLARGVRIFIVLMGEEVATTMLLLMFSIVFAECVYDVLMGWVWEVNNYGDFWGVYVGDDGTVGDVLSLEFEKRRDVGR